MVFGFFTFFIFNICIHICCDYLVCFHTNMPHGWLFFHVKVHCLLAQGHYFCVHFGCHHLLKAIFFVFIFHDDGDDDVHGDNDGVYNFHFFVGF